jgi:crotonobetainyl-CoA:carnitine CoA-transferase CaiB-like acyl-CoA transferase
VRRLLARADVVMENFRPGTMDKLGLGYEAVAALNPRLIYASATGFGSDGPYRDRPGQDLLVQALSGLAARTGDADGPPTPVGPTAVDQHAAMVYAMAILAALFARERTGRGRRVEVDLLSAALDLQTESLTCYLNGGGLGTARAPGNIAAWFSAAPYGIYATGDGHIALSLTPLATVAEALELPGLKDRSESDALSRRGEIAAEIAERLAARPTAHWLEILEAHRVWHAKVQDYGEVVEDPQIRHNGSLRRMPGATGAPVGMVMHPARYDGRSPEVRLVPQPLGAQTREILREIGYDDAEIGALESGGAVRSAAPVRDG